ncbi:MAG TPA: 3-phosphoglycerate dehydrogenase [Candidatus Gallimonas gallistercoris]|uniref:D-3-phosphoglycerate dehydrogenase n=1 Tax=Candidatus Gallimonas gallistercoris TaxID=2838602 RepID=A0A9D2KFU8_9FIRM|nr:3-phosphoglycerate dehydrogenase [Candidatus Gallimonas gallistercoris]
MLKLNSISSVADETFRGYEYSDSVENPEGIILRSFAMHDYPLGDDLLAVARAGAGVNNIPIEKCTEQGIVVFNTPGANANAVKELVLCELFLGGRKVVDGANWVQSLKGQEGVGKLVEKGKGKFAGQEVLGKTLGVIGLGAIGAMVANAAIDLGMSVMGYDPYISVKNAWLINNRVKFTSELSAIFANCDYITLHVPLTPATEGMIGKDSIAACKDGVVIINNARGDLVDSDAMIEAVASGKVSRYITDFPDEKLLGCENILCVPHLGASTPEAEDNCAYMAAKQLTDYLENGNITNSVNYPAVSMPRTSVSRVCVHHKNVKEILSKILAIVSSQGVNIAHMQDQSRGEYAYLVLDLDDTLSPEAVELIRRVSGVIRVRVL